MIFSIDDRDRRNRVALIDGAADESWTYGKLSDEVSRRRDSLADAEKRLLFLFCRNDLASVASYLAAMEAGHAVALLNDQIDAQLAANLISLYRPDWVLTSLPVDPDGVRESRYRRLLAAQAVGQCTAPSRSDPAVVHFGQHG